MKAAILNQYNKEDVNLSFSNLPTPGITADQVLVKSLAAGVNPVDNMITKGEVKLIIPYHLPIVAGNELVGEIIDLGANVKGFQKGDRVFARLPLDHPGAFAEFAAIDSQAIAKVPAYLSSEEAAAIPLTALTAMQAFELLNVQPGKRIFISGGTGGFGGMAIPLAKAMGLYVITNGNGRNAERVLKLGADEFINYRQTDYVKVLKDVDYVIDTLGGQETAKQFQILKQGGSLVSLKGMPNGDFAKRMQLPFFKKILFGLAGSRLDKMAAKHQQKYFFIFVHADGKQLQQAADIFEKQSLHPVVEQVYPFSELNTALQKVAQGHAKGKTVITF